MVASQIRQEAREKLSGKWGKSALMTLIYFLIIFAISFLGGIMSIIPVLGFLIRIGIYMITIPLSYGFSISMVRLMRTEEVEVADFLTIGFSNFARVWCVFGNIVLKLIIPIVLVIVFLFLFAFGIGLGAGSAILGHHYFATFSLFGFIGFIGYIASLIYLVIKGYLYSLSYLVANDNPNMSNKEVVEESERLMKDNRWNLFWLFLTFIGWAILSVFTLYIGLLWLMPYMMIAMIIFYEYRRNEMKKVIVEDEKVTEKQMGAKSEVVQEEIVEEQETSEEMKEEDVANSAQNQEETNSQEETIDKEEKED